ncbi:IclR family transcriptional regulator [Streptomyces antnestii]|uniref:Glycerol operon regulatory protein n=1 Tax=Streptomyces antnestii TaxID=2494256 RepID=A0A437PYN9_9ACTN|nr:IclR family transcriptional regulator C-terminal domain-containing protein [Streptomyces sp. San01]RVU27369.1 IclR family transcriptional regulator [Streptomyces sp. San01]
MSTGPVPTPEPGAPAPAEAVAPLMRGIDVLRRLTDADGSLSLSELARATGLARSTVDRICATLAHMGCLRLDGRDATLAPPLMAVGNAYLGALRLPALLGPRADRLADELDESVSLAVADGDGIRFIHQATRRRAMSLSFRIGDLLPAERTAPGPLFAQAWDGAAWERWRARRAADPQDRGFPALPPRREAEREPFEERAARAGSAGWALDDQLIEPGLVALSVPVRDAEGEIVCVASVVSHTSRHTADSLHDEMLGRLRTAVAEMEEALRPAPTPDTTATATATATAEPPSAGRDAAGPDAAGRAAAGPDTAWADRAPARPDAAGPAAAEPPSAGPDAVGRAAAKPAAPRPDAAWTATADGAPAGPDAAGPDVAKPAAAGPDAAGPDVAGPDAAWAAAAGRTAAGPDAAGPAAARPAAPRPDAAWAATADRAPAGAEVPAAPSLAAPAAPALDAAWAAEAKQRLGRDFVESLARGLSVLTAFGPGRAELTLTDIAAATGLARATARRALITLEHLGYVTSRGRGFRLTPRVLALGFPPLSRLTLADIATPHIRALSKRLRDSVSLAVLDGDAIRYTARVATSHVMSVRISLGTRFPAFATSMGRVLLADLAPASRAAYLARADLTPLTPGTVTGADRLGPLLDDVRAQGYALVDGELEEGLRSVAVPVRDRAGRAVAAVNVATHSSRRDLAGCVDEVLPALRETAARIEADLHVAGRFARIPTA